MPHRGFTRGQIPMVHLMVGAIRRSLSAPSAEMSQPNQRGRFEAGSGRSMQAWERQQRAIVGHGGKFRDWRGRSTIAAGAEPFLRDT